MTDELTAADIVEGLKAFAEMVDRVPEHPSYRMTQKAPLISGRGEEGAESSQSNRAAVCTGVGGAWPALSFRPHPELLERLQSVTCKPMGLDQASLSGEERSWSLRPLRRAAARTPLLTGASSAGEQADRNIGAVNVDAPDKEKRSMGSPAQVNHPVTIFAPEDVVANILAGSKLIVASLNADLTRRYHSAMADYNANVDSGQMSPNPGGLNYRPAPTVPNAWELAPANADGYVFYQPGTTPVCDPDPVNADHSLTQGQINAAKAPNTIDIGKHLQGAWFSLGPADTFEVGKTTPPIPGPDGALHTYEKFGGFAPGTGWYLQLN